MATKASAKKVTKKRVKKNIDRGQAHIQSSFNNTIVTLIPCVCKTAVYFAAAVNKASVFTRGNDFFHCFFVIVHISFSR